MSFPTRGLSALVSRDFRRMLNAGGANVCEVKLFWEEAAPGDSRVFDPNLEGSGPALVHRSDTARATVHFIGPATSGVRLFVEVQEGDAIADFDPETDFSGKRNLRFEILGVGYVPKKAGRELEASWAVVVEGRPAFRTLLLTRTPRA